MVVVVTEDSSEISVFLRKTNVTKLDHFESITIYSGILNNNKFFILDTGYGNIHLGAGLAYICSKYNITSLIGVGNCGALKREKAQPLDIAISTCSIQYDIDYSKLGYSICSLPGIGKSSFPADQLLIDMAKEAAAVQNMNYSLGCFCSANRFIACDHFANTLSQTYNGDFVDTECGSLGAFAYEYKIPYVYVKGISNYSDNSAVDLYHLHQENANNIACEVVYHMLNGLTQGCKSHENETILCAEKYRHFDSLNHKKMLSVINQS